MKNLPIERLGACVSIGLHLIQITDLYSMWAEIFPLKIFLVHPNPVTSPDFGFFLQHYRPYR